MVKYKYQLINFNKIFLKKKVYYLRLEFILVLDKQKIFKFPISQVNNSLYIYAKFESLYYAIVILFKL